MKNESRTARDFLRCFRRRPLTLPSLRAGSLPLPQAGEGLCMSTTHEAPLPHRGRGRDPTLSVAKGREGEGASERRLIPRLLVCEPRLAEAAAAAEAPPLPHPPPLPPLPPAPHP